jgi:hypothetical protein
VGVQVKTPVVALMLAPAGAPGSSEKLNVWPASGSLALASKVIRASSFPLWLPIGSSTGGLLPGV